MEQVNRIYNALLQERQFLKNALRNSKKSGYRHPTVETGLWMQMQSLDRIIQQIQNPKLNVDYKPVQKIPLNSGSGGEL